MHWLASCHRVNGHRDTCRRRRDRTLQPGATGSKFLHNTGTTNYGGVDCQWEGNQLYTSADTSNVGQGGGIRFDWVSSTKSAQRMRVRGNVLIGYVTGIMDNCGGDATSYAVIELNRAATIWHRGTTAYQGLIVNNRTANPNTASPVTAVA